MISFEQILLVLFSLLKIGSCFGILNLFHFLNQDGEVMEHLQNHQNIWSINKVMQCKQINRKLDY